MMDVMMFARRKILAGAEVPGVNLTGALLFFFGEPHDPSISNALGELIR